MKKYRASFNFLGTYDLFSLGEVIAVRYHSSTILIVDYYEIQNPWSLEVAVRMQLTSAANI